MKGVVAVLVFLLACAPLPEPKIPEKVVKERLSEIKVGMWEERK